MTKLVSYDDGSRERLGVLDETAGVVRPVRADAAPTGLLGLVEAGADTSSLPTEDPRPLDELTLLAPLPRPRRDLMCVGKNYAEHASEFAGSGYDATGGGEDVPTAPIVFSKATTSVVGPTTPIDPHTALTSALDYEGEIAVIIGRGGRRIPREQALEHVWGYVLVNDVTARDLQRRHKQWFIGKSLDTFCPMGPWAVTADEVDISDVDLECRVNGEVRQSANTRDLVFDVPELIATLSAGITLEPGDVIATGTPAGVGLGFDPPRFLQPDDVVEVSATGLGRLVNPVARPDVERLDRVD